MVGSGSVRPRRGPGWRSVLQVALVLFFAYVVVVTFLGAEWFACGVCAALLVGASVSLGLQVGVRRRSGSASA